MVNRVAVGTAKHVGKALAYGVVGAMVVLLVVAVSFLNSRPDLKVWHEVRFKHEFTESCGVETFDDYLALEVLLYRDPKSGLNERVEQRMAPYLPGSVKDAREFLVAIYEDVLQ